MDNYFLYKSLHIIFVISWMVGMLYLPRIFVYHADVKDNQQMDDTFKLMEKKLLRIIINPAMILATIFGVLLAIEIGKEGLGGWFHAKLLALIFMYGAHGFLARCMKNFQKGQNKYSSKFYRIINEIPTILMIIIVFLVIYKPF
jgi:protoporphyrinogen IX oxidase